MLPLLTVRKSSLLLTICLIFLTQGALAHAATLFALERGGPTLRIIDRETGADLRTVSSPFVGSWRGMAASPVSGFLFATSVDRLLRIDPITGSGGLVGSFGGAKIRDLSFDIDGQLYGVSASQGSDPNTLHWVDLSSGQATALFPLGGSSGHGIAFDPGNPGILYHLAAGLFEKVSVADSSVTSIPLSGDQIIGRPLGLVFDPIDRLLRFFDDTGRYYTLTLTGDVTDTTYQNPEIYFGLAFGQDVALVHAESLFALERSGPTLRIIDRETGADQATVSGPFVGSWRGMTASPISGFLFASSVTSLWSIDPRNGSGGFIGSFGGPSIRDLSFDIDGQLYGVSASQGSNPNTLHRVELSSGQATALFPLGGSSGHGIAFDPENPGILYHLAAGLFERVSVGDSSVMSIPLSGDLIVGRPLGLVFDPIDRLLRFFDDTGRYYTLSLMGGVTDTTYQNPAIYFGLAFGQGPMFRDGFENGTLNAWSHTEP
jgi:hypothetical protein